ncbi:MAG: LAGLIDADG family homing endonuclease [bacterium]
MKTNNQQERLKMGCWISGFVDGEGCFTVSIVKNTTTKFGKQVFPEFVITQSGKSLDTLKEIQKFFGFGSIVLNKRYDNHKEDLYKFCVRSVSELHTKIIPFFEEFKLKTSKKNDFIIFCKIIKIMYHKKHLSKNGLQNILVLSSKMNRKKNRL